MNKSEQAYKEWEMHKMSDFKLITLLMQHNKELVKQLEDKK
jgi:hypothetical protein